MRILYVTNGFPYPLTSGYLRHYFLIKELAERHAVSLLSIVKSDFLPEHAAALEPFTERVLTFRSAGRSRSLSRKAASRLASLTPGRGGDAAVRGLGQAAGELARKEPFDVVLASGKRTYPALASVPGIPVVADMCDATSSRIRGSLRFARRSRLPVLLLDYAQVRRVERRLTSEAAHVLFASCRDRDALRARRGPDGRRAASTVVPNGVELDFWKRGASELGRDHVVLTGAMDYPPNEDAALFLIEAVMPLVRDSAPGARLSIVGRDPTPRLREAGQTPGVTVTGFVDDVRPYLESASVFAAPLRFGAGIQNKLLEAMAMEVPVVASALAADGLRTDDGREPPVAVAGGARAFADRIVELLRRAGADPTPDRDGRRYVEEHFVWERSGEKLEQVLERVAGAARAAGVAGR